MQNEENKLIGASKSLEAPSGLDFKNSKEKNKKKPDNHRKFIYSLCNKNIFKSLILSQADGEMFILHMGGGNGENAWNLLTLAREMNVRLTYVLIEPNYHLFKTAVDKFRYFPANFHKIQTFNATLEDFIHSDAGQIYHNNIDYILSSGGPLMLGIGDGQTAKACLRAAAALLVPRGILSIIGFSASRFSPQEYNRFGLNLIHTEEKNPITNATVACEVYAKSFPFIIEDIQAPDQKLMNNLKLRPLNYLQQLAFGMLENISLTNNPIPSESLEKAKILYIKIVYNLLQAVNDPDSLQDAGQLFKKGITYYDGLLGINFCQFVAVQLLEKIYSQQNQFLPSLLIETELSINKEEHEDKKLDTDNSTAAVLQRQEKLGQEIVEAKRLSASLKEIVWGKFDPLTIAVLRFIPIRKIFDTLILSKSSYSFFNQFISKPLYTMIHSSAPDDYIEKKLQRISSRTDERQKSYRNVLAASGRFRS